MQIVDDAPLRDLNTFGIAARARRLVSLDSPDQIDAALEACGPAGPLLILGGGSNLLLTRDLDGTVLQMGLRGRSVVDRDATHGWVECAAGEPWYQLVDWTLAHWLYGLENLASIPGQVGASPIQNIGAYGAELREFVDAVEAVDVLTGTRRAFSPAECEFDYRDSRFKHGDGSRWLITCVRFRLLRQPAPRLDYGEIRQQLRSNASDAAKVPDQAADPRAIAHAVSTIRARKLPDPARIGNAGSFFKNPIVPAALAVRLRELNPNLPVYPADNGNAKLAAAWLIEQSGWKGYRRGDAGVHPAHALVLVNYGEASGAEVLALAREIADSVVQRFGVKLEPEPRIV